MRILHAPLNIAGQLFWMSRSLRNLGYQSDSMVFYKKSSHYHYDKFLNLGALSRPKRLCKFLENFIDCLAKYDIFHFHFGQTLLPHNCDLPLIKAAGKKMVMQYWGNDVRRLSIASKRNKYAIAKNSNEDKIIKMLKRQSRFVDAVVVSDYELHENVNAFFPRVKIIPTVLNLDDFRTRIPELTTSRPMIVHAPSHREIKGTEFVQNAVAALKSEGYELDFVLVERVPNPEALRIYEKADIIVDQLRIGSHGKFSIEGMAMGKPVICHIRDDLVDKYPAGLPIVNANPDNIYDNLKMLIENPELRAELGKRGREYAERVHDSRKIARQFIELYESL